MMVTQDGAGRAGVGRGRGIQTRRRPKTSTQGHIRGAFGHPFFMFFPPKKLERQPGRGPQTPNPPAMSDFKLNRAVCAKPLPPPPLVHITMTKDSSEKQQKERAGVGGEEKDDR